MFSAVFFVCCEVLPVLSLLVMVLDVLMLMSVF